MSDEESLSSIASFGNRAPAEPAKGETAKPAEAAPPAAEKPIEPKAEAPEAKVDRDDKGRFTKAEDKSAEKPDKVRPDVAAIIDERRKRQQLEQRIAELTAQRPAEKPSVFDNEDAAINARVDERVASLREQFYKLSVRAARTSYKDFGEAESAFMEAMDKDERLLNGLRASDDPGEYIYSMGIHIRELSDVGGDLMKYREKVSAASQAKLDEQAKQIAAMTAEIEALKKAQADLDSVPRSLNNTSSGPSPKQGESDDDDLKSIARFTNRR